MEMPIFRIIGGGKTLPAFFIGKFKASIPENLSRKVFALEASRPGGANRKVPNFNQTSAYFTKDIERVVKEGNDIQDLQWMMGQISSHYLWPCASLGIFYRKYGTEPLKMVEAPLENIRQLTADDLALGVNNSVIENIIKTGRATYIPDTAFDKISEIVQMPDDTLELIKSNRLFDGIKIDVKAKGWDITKLRDSVNPQTRCLFTMPLKLNDTNIGLFAVGYEYIYFWGNLLPMKELGYHYLMGDALKLALGNLLFPVKK